MSERPHENEVDSFYGNPRGINGESSRKWNLKILFGYRLLGS